MVIGAKVRDRRATSLMLPFMGPGTPTLVVGAGLMGPVVAAWPWMIVDLTAIVPLADLTRTVARA